MKKLICLVLAIVLFVSVIPSTTAADISDDLADTGSSYPNGFYYGTFGGGNCPRFALYGTYERDEKGPYGGWLNEGYVTVYGNYPSGAVARVYARLEFQDDWGLVGQGAAPHGDSTDIIFRLNTWDFYDSLVNDLKPCQYFTRTFITVKIKDRYGNDLTSFYRYAYDDIDMQNYAPRVFPRDARASYKDVLGCSHKWVVEIDGKHDSMCVNPSYYRARVYIRRNGVRSSWRRLFNYDIKYSKDGLAYFTAPDMVGDYELTARTVTQDGDWVSGFIGEAYGWYHGLNWFCIPKYRLWDNTDVS